jgi:hypothetical protein
MLISLIILLCADGCTYNLTEFEFTCEKWSLLTAVVLAR